MKSILSETGDLYAELKPAPPSEWLIYAQERQRQDGSFFDANDAKDLQVLMLKKAATEAAQNQDLVGAIKHELTLLEIRPDSIESRIRLHDYLAKLKKSLPAVLSFSEEEIEILALASLENSLANEIIDTYARKIGENMVSN